MKSTWMFVLFLSVLKIMVPNVQGLFNLLVKNFSMCNLTVDYRHKVYATFHTVADKQYVDGNVTFTIPLDDNLETIFTAQLLIGTKYVHVTTIEEKRACSGIHKNVGEFMYDIERHAQLVPGLCPIPAGRYYLHNYELDPNRITLQGFPFGRLRMKFVVTDKKKKLVGCLTVEAENIPF